MHNSHTFNYPIPCVFLYLWPTHPHFTREQEVKLKDLIFLVFAPNTALQHLLEQPSKLKEAALFGVSMEVAMELEEDLFFADLSKQISLLIMDDDEEPIATYPSNPYQAFSRENYPTLPSPFVSEQTCRRESKGTGVFIPRSSQPRRKHRQGRHSSFNTKSRRRPDNTKMVSQVSYNNSFNPKKG